MYNFKRYVEQDDSVLQYVESQNFVTAKISCNECTDAWISHKNHLNQLVMYGKERILSRFLAILSLPLFIMFDKHLVNASSALFYSSFL